MEREPRADKAAVVDEVRERFADADAVVVTEYRGLDVPAMAELRRSLRDAGAQYKIYKNTLVRRAVADDGPDGLADMLVGPTALAFVDDDPTPVAKALKQFAGDNENLVIKGGVLNGDLLDEAQVRQLAELPSRHELLSGIAAGLAAPLQQIASMMNNILAEVPGLLQALSDKGGASDAAPAAADAGDDAPAEDAPAAADDAGDGAPSEEAAADDAPAENGDDT